MAGVAKLWAMAVRVNEQGFVRNRAPMGGTEGVGRTAGRQLSCGSGKARTEG